MITHAARIPDTLERLHVEPLNSGVCGRDWVADPGGPELESRSPATNEVLGKIKTASLADYESVVRNAADVFADWRMLPAPKRGEIVREIGDELRLHKADLGALVSLNGEDSR